MTLQLAIRCTVLSSLATWNSNYGKLMQIINHLWEENGGQVVIFVM